MAATVTGVRIGPADIGFLGVVGRYGLLSAEDAAEAYASLQLNSRQKRLRLLTKNGLICAVKLSVWWSTDGAQPAASRGGRIPTLYSLTEEGARLVEFETGERPPRVLRSEPSPATFLHRRMIVRVMRAIDQACDAVTLPRPNWIMEQDVWRDAPQQAPPNQRRLLYHEFPGGLTCQPDLAAWMTIGNTDLALLWEIDLSTEGRKQIRRASKTDGYVALFNEQAWRRYWPDLQTKRQYVVWVAPTLKRVRSLQEALRDQPIAPLCRFLSAEHLADPSSLLTSPIWETVTGELRPLYRPGPAFS